MRNIFIYLILVTSFIGCSTAGRVFNYQSREKLELGVTTYEYAIEIFGESTSSSETTNEDGVYKTIGYVYGSAGLWETAARALTLEFKQGLLNGFSYVSNYSEDKTDFQLEEIKKIVVKSSNKTDVLRIMGEPSTKILCPSVSFSTDCEKCKEIWAWLFIEQGGKESKSKKIFINFDENGVVLQIGSGSGIQF